MNEEEIRSLAEAMTWKTALMNIPFGGSKGGVNCDPQQMSQGELERTTRKFVATIRWDRIVISLRQTLFPIHR